MVCFELIIFCYFFYNIFYNYNYNRCVIWEGNLDYIEKYNLVVDCGDYSFWLGMNEYGDMVSESRDLVNIGVIVFGLV